MANWKKVGIIFMYFMSVWLHITCEVNQNVYLLIHFDDRKRGEKTGRERYSTVYGQDSLRDDEKKIIIIKKEARRTYAVCKQQENYI